MILLEVELHTEKEMLVGIHDPQAQSRVIQKRINKSNNLRN